MPKNAKGSDRYLGTFNPIQGMTSNFTDASSELSIQIRSTTLNTFVELQSELIGAATQPVVVLSSRGHQLGWEIRCKIQRAHESGDARISFERCRQGDWRERRPV
jgi:hypothetical protein